MICTRARHSFGIVLLLLMSTMRLSAQTSVPTLPGTYGTEFWAGFLINNGTKMDDASLKLTIYAVAEEQVTVVVALGSSPKTAIGTIEIPAGGGMGKFDGLDPKQVYLDAKEIETVVNKGVVIYAKDGKTKFTCYAFAEAEGSGTGAGSTRDATILLPKELLWKEYFVQTYLDDAKSTEFMVVATENNTNVTIYPVAATSKGGQKWQPISINLNAGQVYLIQSKAKEQTAETSEPIDMSGSMVCSDKPVAVFNGNECAKIPNTAAYSGNHAYEQVIPQMHWGSEFYVGIAGGTKLNKFYVTAFSNNTTVQITRYNKDTKALYSKTYTLNASQSISPEGELDQTIVDAHITADKPVLCYDYLTCGAVNQESYYDEEGTTRYYNWGNPTNAMVAPWSHRVKEMSFYTEEIVNQTATAKQKHFVQLIIPSADKNKITLDGTLIGASQFTTMGTDNTKAYANIELTTHGKHRITTSGDGFTGYVMGMTSEARAYQYTLGFNPPTPYDSLYIKEDVMSPVSYDLPKADSGYYQRQYRDWPKDEERLDTAIVCDSTILHFLGLLPDRNAGDSVVWKVYECDNKSFAKTQLVFDSVAEQRGKEHTLEYMFIVDPQKGRKPTARDPFQYYTVEMERYKNHIICTDLDPDPDTLRTMVRVNRQYNDTTWRIVCETDTIHFFYDNHNHGYVGDSMVSIFKYNKEDKANDTIKFTKGANSYTRKYETVSGCDSIVTLMIWGCDTIVHTIDTTVCQLDVANLKIVIDGMTRLNPSTFKIKTGAEEPYDSTYSHVRWVKTCIQDPEAILWINHCKDFKGCKDSLALNLKIMPIIYYPKQSPSITPWCTQGDVTAVYKDWTRKDGTLIEEISQTDPRFQGGDVGIFLDTVWWEGTACPDCPNGRCPKEVDKLILQKVSNVDQTDTVHICQNQTYTHTKFMAKDRKEYKGWELPVNTELVEYHLVAIMDGKDTLCQYNDTLRLWVHPIYQDTMTSMHNYESICRDKPFAWTNHTGEDGQHLVWDKVHGKRVLASALPTDKAGEFTFIDSLKTITCPDCKQGTGCDSIWTLHLTVNPIYQIPDSFGLCDNDTLKWQGKYYYGRKFDETKIPLGSTKIKISDDYLTKNYEDTVRYQTKGIGCDSIHTLKIRLYETYVTEVDTAICANQTYWFLGNPYHFAPNDNPDTLRGVAKTAVCDCDSGVIHYIRVYPIYTDHDVDTTCQVQDGKYVWETHPLEGDPRRQIWMVDSAHSNKWKVWSDEIPLSKVGRYTLIDSLQSHACEACNKGKGLGCDSVYIRDLKINPTYFEDDGVLLLSKEGTAVWDTMLLVGPKAPIPTDPEWTVVVLHKDTQLVDSFLTTYNVGTYPCDSVRTVFVQLVDIFRDTTWAPVCANCTFDWHVVDPNTGKDSTIYLPRIGETIPKAGETIWYYDSLKNSLGYDSIYNLQLTGMPNKDSLMRDTTCQGEGYTWERHEGHQLYIAGEPVAEIPTEVNGWVTVVDSMKTDTIYRHPKSGDEIPVHCDSIWTLKLYIAPTYNETYNAEAVHFEQSMCSNDTLLWNRHLFAAYDFDETAHPLMPAPTTRYDSIIRIPSSAGALFYDSTFTEGTKLGCDSINYLTIHIEPSYFMPLQKDIIGDNDSVWSFGGKGGTLPLITRKDLVPDPDYTTDDRPTYEFFFIDTIPASSSCRCDSIVRDSVWIFPTYRYIQDTSICSNNDWSWRPESPNAERFVDMNLRPSGTYYDSLKTQPRAGRQQMDSVYVLKLTILPSSRVFDDSVRCKNEIMYWNGQTVAFPTTHLDVNYKKDKGAKCDSVIDLTMTWYDFYHYEEERPYPDNDSICRYDSYVWISEWDESRTPHTKALYGENGERFDSVPTDTVGWVIIYDSLHTSSECHCDSTFKLRYFVKPSYRYFETEVACTGDTVLWRDSNYVSDKAGIVRDFRRYDVKGIACDSIYYLILKFNQSYDSLKVDTICATDLSFKWREHELGNFVQRTQILYTPQDTSLMDRLETSAGCDSIFRLQLNVRPIYTAEWNDTICESEKYHLNEKVFDSTGVYSDTLKNHFGCDSIQIVHLEVVPITRFTITPVVSCGNDGSYTLHYEYNDGDYAPRRVLIVYDSLAQANRFPTDTTILPVEQGSKEVEVPVFQPESETDYLRPNVYSATAYLDNGLCQNLELLRKDYLLTINYPSWVAEQHWSDAICVLNKDYNGGYEFYQYQWYKNGEMLIGETKSYLFLPQYLDLTAQYQVMLSRTVDSISIMTCPTELSRRDSSLMPKKMYVSVVPSMVAKESPYTNIMCNEGGSYTIYNSYGAVIQTGRFEPGEHNAYQVKLQTMPGIYFFDLKQDNNGEQRTVKVIVQ